MVEGKKGQESEQGGVMKKYEGEEECLEWEAVKCNNAQNQNTSPEWFKVIHQADLSTSV